MTDLDTSRLLGFEAIDIADDRGFRNDVASSQIGAKVGGGEPALPSADTFRSGTGTAS